VVTTTGRAVSRAGRLADPAYLEFVARIAQQLSVLRFDPAEIGTCPVNQVTTQSFVD
jgi:hypothetical protein